MDQGSATQQRRGSWLNRTVVATGLASLFSDTSHEMATAVLPLFLVTLAGASGPAVLGIIEGCSDLLSSAAKLWAGSIGDHLRQRRFWCSAGYLVTALGKVSFAVAGSWWHVLIGRMAAWMGRGFRSPLRDALLADDTTPESYGKAFGLERAGDSLGAVSGPTLSLVLLAHAFPLRGIFVVSLIPGLLAAAVIAFGVRERVREVHRAPQSPFRRVGELPAAFRRYLLAVGLFGIGDFSNTLLILWAVGSSGQISSTARLTLPVALYIGYNAVSASFAYLAGALSDGLGRRQVLGVGYACGFAAAALIALGGHSLPLMILVFGLSGICMGAQEAVEKATAADFLAAQVRALGFGALAVVNGIGDFVASILVGGLWATFGTHVGFGVSAALCGLGTVSLFALLPRQLQTPTEGEPVG
jgi:MFS family permease